jgi:hypothetical protein
MRRRSARVRDAGAVTVHRIRYEGPRDLVVRVSTRLADAPGVDLVASEPPSLQGDLAVLEVAVEGERAAVADAITAIGDDLPRGASIRFVDR